MEQKENTKESVKSNDSSTNKQLPIILIGVALVMIAVLVGVFGVIAYNRFYKGKQDEGCNSDETIIVDNQETLNINCGDSIIITVTYTC